MLHELKSEITAEYRAREIIEYFRAALVECLDNKKVTQVLFEVNLSPEGGISRCNLRPQIKIK